MDFSAPRAPGRKRPTLSKRPRASRQSLRDLISMRDALLCAAWRSDKGAAEYFRTILDFVGVSAVLIEEVYFRPSAHAKREAALTKLGTAIDQHIVVPPWRRAAGMNSL